jgi:hypothetical protein
VRSLATALIVLGLAGPYTASLCAEEPPVVALVIDTSRSIGQPGLDRARELALGMLPGLGPGAEAAVFTFDDQSRLVQARTSRPEDLRRALSRISMSGRYTALYDALYDASRYLRDAPGARKAIVLITDGLDENSSLKIEDGLKVAVDNGTPVFAVGVGNVQERELRRIAKLTGGEYFAPGTGSAPVLAARIAGGPAAAAAAAAPAEKPAGSAPGGHAPSPAREAASHPAIAAPTPATGASTRGRWIGLGLALAGVLAIGWWALGRRSQPRCPTCRRPLPDRLSECAFCSREPATVPPPSRARASTAGKSAAAKAPERGVNPDTAPTVLARVGAGTDEYLEKTVVLRERPVLSVTRGPGMGLVYEVKTAGPTSLGRAKVNDIVLNEDVAVSSEHCRIRPEDGTFVVHDLKSTNGTFVNDKRVSRQPLTEGDTIQVGETYLQFRLEHRRS